MLEGVLVAILSSCNPSIQSKLGLTDGEFGSAVLFFYLGTVIATPIAALTIKTMSTKNSTIFSAILFGGSLPLIALAPNLGILIVTLFLFGFTEGIMDVSMNSAAVLTEIVASFPILGSYHGTYSLSAALSSFIASVFISNGWSPINMFYLFAVTATVLSTVSSFLAYNGSDEEKITILHEEKQNNLNSESHSKQKTLDSISSIHQDYQSVDTSDDVEELFSSLHEPDTNFKEVENNSRSSWLCAFIPNRATLSLCAVGFLASFGEGSIVTWSVAFYKRELSASVQFQTLGFTSFMVCMATGRFLCDFFRRKVGRQRLMVAGGILACSGQSIVVAAPSIGDLSLRLGIACVGFAVTGLGLSTLIPTAFSTAGHLPGVHAGTSIAMVAAFTYSGSIISPPLVGGISDLIGLRYALLVQAICLGLISVSGGSVPYESNDMDSPSLQTISNPLLENDDSGVE